MENNWKEELDKEFNIFGECNPPHCRNLSWGESYTELEKFIETQIIEKLIEEMGKNLKGSHFSKETYLQQLRARWLTNKS